MKCHTRFEMTCEDVNCKNVIAAHTWFYQLHSSGTAYNYCLSCGRDILEREELKFFVGEYEHFSRRLLSLIGGASAARVNPVDRTELILTVGDSEESIRLIDDSIYGVNHEGTNQYIFMGGVESVSIGVDGETVIYNILHPRDKVFHGRYRLNTDTG